MPQQTGIAVLGVGVGVPQLVGDAVQEQVPALRVHVHVHGHGEVLEDIHVAAVSNTAHAGAMMNCMAWVPTYLSRKIISVISYNISVQLT